MSRHWTAEDVLELTRSFQPACVVMAAAELDVVGALAGGPKTAEELAERIDADPRAMRVLADALAALELLVKREGRYSPAAGAAQAMSGGEGGAMAMIRHQANCLRSWAELARVARTGRTADRPPSILGEQADLASFIEAMEVASRQAAPSLVAAIGPPEFARLLDVGGGPATWTIAFLKARPDASATLFERPGVLPIARRHLEQAGLADRVTLAGGDYNSDEPLPAGADLAWVSAIVHQNSRPQNRRLLAKVHAALADGGKVLIRDIVMDESRTSPAAGALFAVNMLVNTPAGGTFTFAELSEDLADAGFREPTLIHSHPGMNSVVRATK